MTDAKKPDLGRFGLFGSGVTPDQAKAIEALGYGAVTSEDLSEVPADLRVR